MKLKMLRTLCFAWVALAALFSAPVAHSQTLTWKERGPNNMGGRTRTIVVDASGTVWAGAVGGGLWKSTDHAQNWSSVDGFNKPQTDTSNVNLAVSSIGVDGNTIYVGTGEMYFNYNQKLSIVVPAMPQLNTDGRGYLTMVGLPGQGVFVSKDGGATFSNANATWNNPQDPTKFLNFPTTSFDITNPWLSVQKVAARNGRAFAATLSGFYYSDNQFDTAIAATDNFTSGPGIEGETVLDIELGSGNIVYATTKDGTFISYDNGATFTKRIYGTDLPRTDTTDTKNNPKIRTRVEVAVAPSNPDYVYIAEVNAGYMFLGMWKSTDAGNTWTRIAPYSTAIISPENTAFTPLESGSSGHGLYSLMLGVDPADPDRVFLGGQEWFQYTPHSSTNPGGWSHNGTYQISIQPADPKFVPGNLHVFAHDPTDNKRFYIGSDQGITVSNDGGNYFYMMNSGYHAAEILGVGPDGNDGVLAAMPSKIIYRDAASASNFSLRSTGKLGLAFLKPSIFFPMQFIAGEDGGKVFTSPNQGTSWSELCLYPDPVMNNCNAARFPNSVDVHNDTLGYLCDKDKLTSPPDITPVVLDEVLLRADGMVLDTVVNNNNPNEKNETNPRYLFVGNAYGVWLITAPFWTFTDGANAAKQYAIRISPPFNSSQATNENWGEPSAIAVSGDTNHTVFVGTSRGRVYRIQHAHNPCSPLYRFDEITPADSFHTADYISDIAVDPANRNRILVTQGGYTPQVAKFDGNTGLVYPTTKITATFNANDTSGVIWYPQNMDISGPSGSYKLPYCPVYTAIFNPDTLRDPGEWIVMIGTEYGTFTASQLNDQPLMASEVWTEQNAGTMCRVPVYDLAFNPYSFETFMPSPNSQKRAYRVKPNAQVTLYAATAGRGVQELSIVVGVKEDQQRLLTADNLLTLYPNPSDHTANLRLNYTAAGRVSAHVLNMQGQTVMEVPAAEVPENGSLSFSTANLAPGLYFVRSTVSVQGVETTRTQKLVVRH